ncbi:MAG: hypothetical protein JW861_05140 [Bacteroidales bacterium]|nr:hypothetical protein [Bacteroidales bacterium]
MRVFIRISYLGTLYAGWQVQPGRPTVQGVFRAEVIHEAGAGRVRIVIGADRFLRGMVRRIAGSLVLTGKGRITPQEYLRMLETGDRFPRIFSVPARGLHLTQVEYPWPGMSR